MTVSGWIWILFAEFVVTYIVVAVALWGPVLDSHFYGESVGMFSVVSIFLVALALLPITMEATYGMPLTLTNKHLLWMLSFAVPVEICVGRFWYVGFDNAEKLTPARWALSYMPSPFKAVYGIAALCMWISTTMMRLTAGAIAGIPKMLESVDADYHERFRSTK